MTISPILPFMGKPEGEKLARRITSQDSFAPSDPVAKTAYLTGCLSVADRTRVASAHKLDGAEVVEDTAPDAADPVEDADT
ncbi:hypothetical protein J4E08_22205 [Sagittula sp. NFXS13]|uniref:hypothetical protein n=1 Tax=Sagittula sp. NFXS13 TaxID=2819095 RepID=UPI0032DEF162